MLSINYIEVKTYCHATEDLGKVEKALLNIFPKELRSRVKISKYIVKGHYGNPITVLRVVVKGENAVKTLEYIGSMLNSIEKSVLKASYELRFDRGSNKLYIRFDKQSLYHGKFVISDSDDIVHVVISFKGRGGIDEAKNLLSKLGIL